MTNKNLYDSLLHILRKESKGLAVSPDAFSDLLRDENIALFNEHHRAFEVGQIITDALRPFKTTSKLSLTYDADYYAKYSALPANYQHITGLQVGLDIAFTWTNAAHALGYIAWDTLTTSGVNITSAVTALGSAECTSSAISGLSASTDYTLYIYITDTSVSGDSDMPRIYAYIPSDEEVSLTDLVAGMNTVTITTDSYGQINLVLRATAGKVIDISATFALIKESDDDTIVPVDVVTDEEWTFRRIDALTAPSATYPIAKIAGEGLYVLPSSLSKVILTYLKSPSTPFFDYYYDDDYNIQYLSASGTHLLTTGETGRLGETAGSTVISSTVELEWEDTEKIKILHRIVTKLGVSMDEQLVAQYATAKEKE